MLITFWKWSEEDKRLWRELIAPTHTEPRMCGDWMCYMPIVVTFRGSIFTSPPPPLAQARTHTHTQVQHGINNIVWSSHIIHQYLPLHILVSQVYNTLYTTRFRTYIKHRKSIIASLDSIREVNNRYFEVQPALLQYVPSTKCIQIIKCRDHLQRFYHAAFSCIAVSLDVLS